MRGREIMFEKGALNHSGVGDEVVPGVRLEFGNYHTFRV